MSTNLIMPTELPTNLAVRSSETGNSLMRERLDVRAAGCALLDLVDTIKQLEVDTAS